MPLAVAASVHINSGTTAVVTTPTLNAGVANCYIMVGVVSNSNNGLASGVLTVKTGSGTTIPVHHSYVPSAGSTTDVYALFSSGIFNDTIVVTQNAISFCTIDAFAVSGSGQTSLVFDSGGPIHAAVDPFNFTTNGADRLLFAFFREGAVASPIEGAGFTKISGADYTLSEYKLVPSATTTSCAQGATAVGSAAACIGTAIPQGGAISLPVTLGLGAGGVKYYATQTATFTATGLNGGTDFPANSLVVVLFYSHSGSGDLIAPKIGGVAATNVYGYALNGAVLASIYTLQVGGTSIPDTIGSDNGHYYADLFFRAYILTGDVDPAPIIGGPLVDNSTPSPVTIPAGGVGIVAIGCDSSMSAGTTVTWSPPALSPSDGFSRTDGIGLFASYNTSTAGNWAMTYTGTPSLDYKSIGSVTLAFKPLVAPPVVPVTVKGGTASMMGV